MENSAFDYITLALAVGGFVLGVTNYLTDLLRRRHRARITFANSYSALGHIGLGVTVENNGETTFTVCDIGFDVKRKRQLLIPFKDGDKLPKVLHPGEHCEVIIPGDSYLNADGRDIEYVFARLPSGQKFRSKKLTRKFLGNA